MVIKILSSSASFSGVDYNERKNAQGKSELLVARNFGSLEMKQGEVSKADYINYLKDYSATNTRVKNSQFHAVLSCKGREKSHDELREVAERYLDSMGYGHNPYLIYAHSDTENNHVHIISSRVNQQGAKIDHSFERVRTQNFINDQVLNQDQIEKFGKSLTDAFKYKFSTTGQLRQLMESRGYRSQEESNTISFYRGGQAVGSFPLADITSKLSDRKDYDQRRITQVKQLFEKYRLLHDPKPTWVGDKRPGQTPDSNLGRFESDFSRHMEKKFDIEVVFHQAKNQKVQGYTVIDHSKKQVYKGSEIMKLRDLVELPRLGATETVEKIASQHLEGANGFTALRDRLKEEGFLLNQRGEIKKKGVPQPIYRLDAASMKRLRYDERLLEARKYAGNGEKELRIIAARFGVNAESLIPSEITDLSATREKLNSALNNSDDSNATLDSLSLRLIPMDGELFILDEKAKIVVNCDKIVTPEMAQRLMLSPESHSHFVQETPAAKSEEHSQAPQLSRVRLFRQSSDKSDTTPADLPRLLGAIGDEHDPAESAAKRRRRKR